MTPRSLGNDLSQGMFIRDGRAPGRSLETCKPNHMTSTDFCLRPKSANAGEIS